MQKTRPWKPVNGLLSELALEICHRLKPDLVLVDLAAGTVLYESDAPQTHVYFPRSGLVSLLTVMENGDSGEVAMVGREGMVGVALMVDSQTTPNRAVVQVAGEAYLLKADAVAREFRLGGGFQIIALRYTQALIAQIAQVAMCTRHHPMEKQLCRWLLLAADRHEEGDMPLTHERIANLLGVRREGVTEAAGRLQEAGLIRYSRGKIAVCDRLGLAARGCECYATISREYARLLKGPFSD